MPEARLILALPHLPLLLLPPQLLLLNLSLCFPALIHSALFRFLVINVPVFTLLIIHRCFMLNKLFQRGARLITRFGSAFFTTLSIRPTCH